MITAATALPLGEVFPPRSPEEIEAYPIDDLRAGFREWDPNDPAPGPNRSPGYRWAWQNCQRDHHPDHDDGFDHLRHAAIRMRKASHGHAGRSRS